MHGVACPRAACFRILARIIVSTVRVVSESAICRAFVLTVFSTGVISIVSQTVGIVSWFLLVLQVFFMRLTLLTVLTVFCGLFLGECY
jgi:hypothetical protein